ncbi:MAG: TonB-dependent receptor plug domain-containing protein [Gammaproteobacteria bacterium]|nr:TonB-dependent receptor plug domain-containing protein [Gammaproteobacteria bacterium]
MKFKLGFNDKLKQRKAGLLIAGLFIIVPISSSLHAVNSEHSENLFNLDLEQLLNIEVTSAKKSKENIKDTAAYITVVTKEDIDLFGWRSLSEIIDSLAGFMVSSDRVYNFIITRGAYQSNDPNSRILLLLNGHSVVENFGYFNGQLATVDVNHIERVEVVRGPGSAVYGTNAMYAVINVVTRKDRSFYGGAVGSFNDFKLHGQAIYEWDDWNLSTQIAVQQGMEESIFLDEYNNNDYPTRGRVAGKGNRGTKEVFTSRLSNDNLYVQLFHHNRRKYVPTGIFGGRIDQNDTFFEDQNQHLELGFDKKTTDNLSFNGRVYYDSYQFYGRYEYLQDTMEVLGPNYPSELNKIHSSSYGFELIADTNWNPHSRTIYGFEYKSYRNYDFIYRSENDPLQQVNIDLVVDPNETIRSGFFSHEIRFYPELRLDVGVHFDDYETVGRYYSFRTAFSYNYQSDSVIRLLYGESFRAPNSWELNGGFFIDGNQALVPETIQTYEITLDKTLRQNWQFHSSIYFYETENTIRTDDTETFVNSPGIEGVGIELDLNYRGDSWRAFASVSYGHVTNQVDSTRVPFSPRQYVKLGSSHQISDSWHVSMELKHFGDRLNPIETADALQSYTLINLKVGDFMVTEGLAIDFSVKNLFDKQYQHIAFPSDLSSDYLNLLYPVYDIPATGRQWWINFNVNW